MRHRSKKPQHAKAPKDKDDGTMSLRGHLKELRNRVILCAVVFVVFTVIFLGKAQDLVTMFTDMGEELGYVFVYIAPQELLMQYFKVSLIAAVFAALPLILYECWAFASPGLTRTENLTMLFVMIFGFLCFLVGLYFAWWIILPFMLNFFIELGTGSTITANISVESYLNFLMTVFVIFGVVFEMPLVSVILSRIGILTPQFMRKWRSAAIVLIFILAAVITPPDVFSQIMVVIPMLALYELSILLSEVVTRFFRKKEEPEEAEEA